MPEREPASGPLLSPPSRPGPWLTVLMSWKRDRIGRLSGLGLEVAMCATLLHLCSVLLPHAWRWDQRPCNVRGDLVPDSLANVTSAAPPSLFSGANVTSAGPASASTESPSEFVGKLTVLLCISPEKLRLFFF